MSLQAADAPGPEILVVDDQDAVRQVLDLLLRRAGFTVYLAASGAKAVEFYRQHHAAVRGVLLDVQMPEMDGPATLAALQEIDPGVRCCFMSGDVGKYSSEDLIERGALHLLAKPFTDWATLARTIRGMVESNLCCTG